MGKKVFANGMEIVHKAGDSKVIAAFPDVCMSPPPPPAGPVPVPYPNSSSAADLQDGSKTVLIGGKPLALAKKSFYKSSPVGNEAATRNFGASVLTHTITGKTYFAAYSMDVKVEGKGVPRHLDLATTNHASEPGSALSTTLETASPAAEIEGEELTECPCCKGPLHDHQKDPVTGRPYKTIKEDEFYKRGLDKYEEKYQQMLDFLAKNPGWESGTTVGKDGIARPNMAAVTGTTDQLAKARADLETIRNARNIQPPCPNVHNPADTGCGVHLDKTHELPKTSDPNVRESLGFNDRVREECIKGFRAKGSPFRGRIVLPT